MRTARRQKAPRPDRERSIADMENDSNDRLRDGPAGAIQGFVLISIGMILTHIFTS